MIIVLHPTCGRTTRRQVDAQLSTLQNRLGLHGLLLLSLNGNNLSGGPGDIRVKVPTEHESRGAEIGEALVALFGGTLAAQSVA